MTTQERESVQDLMVAMESMLEAHEALMPGLRYIAVEDYALQNGAPNQARRALASMRKRLSGSGKP